MKKRAPALAAIALLPAAIAWSAAPLVLQSDFGVKDAAVREQASPRRGQKRALAREGGRG